MKKAYVITETGNQCILQEKSQETLIIVRGSRDRIIALAKKLNGGTGFRGQTPPFFANPTFDLDKRK